MNNFFTNITLSLLCALWVNVAYTQKVDVIDPSVSAKPIQVSAAYNSSLLHTQFLNPPKSIQTSVYWYWISDHISEEGVVKDLQAMKKAGINRAFIGNIGLDENGGKVKFGTELWWKILHTALKTATELDIEIGVFNSPGWSQSGGPWIKPNQAMRYLASTSTTVDGKQKVDVVLYRPKGDFEDVKVLAFPAIADPDAVLNLKNTQISASPSLENLQHLMDNDPKTTVEIGQKNNASREVAIDFVRKTPFTLRAMVIYATERNINSPAKIQYKANGVYRTLVEFKIDRHNGALNVGFNPFAPTVVSVPATTATDFRLVVSNISDGAGFKEIELSSIPMVESYPEKTLAKMFQDPLPYWNEYQWRTQPIVDQRQLLVDPTTVIDVSRFMTGDRLVWNPAVQSPDAKASAKWTIMRMGMLPTGVTNAPASKEATGLEVDKMSKKHVEAHFEAFMGEIVRRIPVADRKSWKVIVQDSYETGGQNFTDDMLSEFEKRYGYNPLPFLPTFEGVVIGNPDMSDRFLWDWRRLIADRVAYDYVGGLRDIAHKNGLTTWLECYGHWGFPGEFLQYGGQSDEIGGEFWSQGSLGDIENRAASSCGHIYGKTKISAESFTAAGAAFASYPAQLKQRGDRFFAEGINNSLLHVYIHQAYEDKNPGMNAWFGTEFNRKNTWFSQMDLFTDYLKRVNMMLQQGTNIADVAYFIGEDAPKMTGITDPALPRGYQFDYINAEVILDKLFVKDGLLTLPHGTQYRILVLPKLESMRPELLAKIKQLIEDGATVLGPPPSRSPSFQNYPQADKIVSDMAQAMWSKMGDGARSVKIGKGLLINGLEMQEALDLITCVPDCKTPRTDPIVYGHRSTADGEIYFISNQSDVKISCTPEFRVKSLQPELWEPTSGAVRKLPEYTHTSTGCAVPLQLEAFESVFVVFPKNSTPNRKTLAKTNYPVFTTSQEIVEPWTVSFTASGLPESQLPDITMSKLTDLSENVNPKIKHYSGTLIYKTSVKMAKVDKSASIFIDLNKVGVMAKVKINKVYVGGVWTAPYRVDISSAIKKGVNEIEIEMVTTWVNRLIGDAQRGADQKETWTIANGWKADSPLHPSGLVGPVVISY